MKTVEAELNQVRQKGLERSLSLPCGIDFSSNDFFGLSRSPSIRIKLIRFLQENGPLGSTGSRLISGQNRQIDEVEKSIEKGFSVSSCLFFGSGYLANLGVLSALGSSEDEFFSDEFNHASLIDGIRISRARVSIFKHNDLNDLYRLLKNSKARRKIVVTESVFSMDGDQPDLESLCSLVTEFDCFLVLDEAHATGVCGSKGHGLLEGARIDAEKVVSVHTCGKALGGYGAFVLSSQMLRKLFINKSRSFIYSTGLSPLHAVQTQAALNELQLNQSHRIKLKYNIDRMHSLLKKAGLQVHKSHIISLLISGNDRVLRVANRLRSRGYDVRAIRSPTVAKGKERIRLTIKSFHDASLYKDFLQHLTKAME